MVSLFFILLFGIRVQICVDIEQFRLNIGIYLFKRVLAFKIAIFACKGDLYMQIGKRDIKKLNLTLNKKIPFLKFKFNKTDIVVGCNVSRVGDVVTVNIIKNLLGIIVNLNEIDLGEYSFLIVPIENKTIAHINIFINFKNLLKIVFGGIKWMNQKTV